MLVVKLPRFWSRYTCVLFIGLSASGCCIQPPEEQTSTRLVAAHRGYHVHAAGNTIEALVQGARRGVPILEFDVRLSADGEPFLFHDRRLSAANLISGKELDGREFSSLSSAEIVKLRLNDRYLSTVPSLPEALKVLTPFESVLLPDPKAGSIGRVIEVVTQHGLADRVIVQCSSAESFEYIRRHSPKVKILARIKTPEHLHLAMQLRPLIVQIDEGLLTGDTLATIRGGWALVLVKTLDHESDKPEHHNALFQQGVDIILSDNVDGQTRGAGFERLKSLLVTP